MESSCALQQHFETCHLAEGAPTFSKKKLIDCDEVGLKRIKLLQTLAQGECLRTENLDVFCSVIWGGELNQRFDEFQCRMEGLWIPV